MLQETIQSPGQWEETITELLPSLSAEPVASRLGSTTPVPQAQTHRIHLTLCQCPLLDKPFNIAWWFFVIYARWYIYYHYCHSDHYRQQLEPPSPNQDFDLLFLLYRNFCSKIHYNQYRTNWQVTAERALRNIRMNLNWDKDIYFTTLSLICCLSPIKLSKGKALSHTHSSGVKLCIQS